MGSLYFFSFSVGLKVFLMQKVGEDLNSLYKKLVTLVVCRQLGGWRTGGGQFFTVVHIFLYLLIFEPNKLSIPKSSVCLKT